MKDLIKKLLITNHEKGDHLIRHGIGSGIRMMIDPSEKAQRILGLDERELTSSFARFSRQSQILIDVGASDGYYGLIFKKLQPSGKVHMLDAGQAFLDRQTHNFALNGFSIEGQHAVMVGAVPGSGFITLDGYCADLAESLLIKIDVEGAEFDVLNGGKHTLATKDCNIIIETHSEQLEKDCIFFSAGCRIHR